MSVAEVTASALVGNADRGITAAGVPSSLGMGGGGWTRVERGRRGVAMDDWAMDECWWIQPREGDGRAGGGPRIERQGL